MSVMKWQRSKTNTESEMTNDNSDRLIKGDINEIIVADYLKFVVFCALLIVPIYAIAKSAIKHDWIMMIIDALLVPVGFVHGLLMLFGFVN